MKKIKNIFTLLISITIICINCLLPISAMASVQTATNNNEKILNPAIKYAVDVITNQYGDYYTIHNTTVEILQTTMIKNQTEYYVVISFDRMLKANNATELPFVAGSIAAASNSNSNLLVNDYVTNLVYELENEYIGKLQNTSVYAYIYEPINLNADMSYSVFIESMTGEKVSPDVLAPSSYEAMYQSGLNLIDYLRSNTSTLRTSPTINDDIMDYDRVAARDYARDWSCTSGALLDHESCHNADYSFYDNVDCANFVSQCLYDGGLPTDTTWYKDSNTWVGVSRLCSYVEDNNLFFETSDEMKAFAGSIIRWTSGSHVGLVDQNDTVTMTFCAHTRCRRSCPWDGEDVYFYVPYWDSYADDWTELD